MSIELTFCELREKEVVNIIDGRRLGRLLDIAFSRKGHIVGIIVPGERRFFKNITGGDSIFIKWQHVKKIGQDAILVELGGKDRDDDRKDGDRDRDKEHGGRPRPPHPPCHPCPPFPPFHPRPPHRHGHDNCDCDCGHCDICRCGHGHRG